VDRVKRMKFIYNCDPFMKILHSKNDKTMIMVKLNKDV
jgi:hypothetical protein